MMSQVYDFDSRYSPDYESFTVEKKDGLLIFESYGGYQSRNSSTIWCIENADKIYNWSDFKKIKIITNDGYSENGDYTYSTSNTDFSKLIPDFNFYHWSEAGIHDYEDTIREIEKAGPYEVHKVGWVGNIETNTNRVKLCGLGSWHPDDLDILSINWANKINYISLPSLVKKYSILIDIEGWGYSGRLKYFLFSKRPLLLVDRPHKEYFFEFMKPWTHYIPVNRDLSDLMEKVRWTKENYEKTLLIAENAYVFANEHCTRTAAYRQWNKIITGLA